MTMKHSIRSKIMLLAIIPMLLIAVLLLGYACIGGISNTTTTLEASMTETAKISSLAIENELEKYETAVTEAACNQIFQSADFDAEEAIAYLEEVKERCGFLRIGYTDVNGVNQNGSDFSERQYFKDCRETLAAVTSDPYSSKDGGGMLSVLFCAPIVRGGEFCGIVYGAGDAKLLTDIIGGVLVGEDGRNFVIDSTGTYIAHSDIDLASSLTNPVTEAKNDPSFSGQAHIVSQMLSERTGCVKYSDGGTQRIACFVPVEKGSGWGLAVTVNHFDFIRQEVIGLAVLTICSAAVIVVSILLIAKTSKRIVKPISDCTHRIELLADGDLMSDIEPCSSDDEAGVLVDSTRRNIRHLNSMIRHISESLEQMASGDFTHDVEGKFRGDFEPIKASLDNILTSLRSVLSDIDRAAGDMSDISGAVVDTSNALSEGVKRQTGLIGEMSEIFDCMKDSVRMNAENTASVVELAAQTRSGVQTSGEQMDQLLTAMREMSDLSNEIRSINDVIGNIAFQTHILSLNAAIEAAAAGDSGRGFGVVADEVGQLAGKCGESAQKTTALINRTVDAISNGMKLAETVAASFGAVSRITDEVEQNISDISAASEEQAASIEIVCEKMNIISSEVENTSSSAEKSSEISEKLLNEADILKGQIRRFTLK
ncbi:MAG: methyl-accepting chemotaxis protein [Oscillospiraceae bacterium]